MNTIWFFLLLIIIVVGSMLGIAVYNSNRKLPVNRWFLAISIFVILWNIFGFIAHRVSDEQISAIFVRANISAVSLYFVSFYYFSLYFPIRSKRTSVIDIIVTIIGVVFSLLALFTPLIISSVHIISSKQMTLQIGLLGNYFYGLTLLLTLWIIISLIKKYSNLDKVNKLKVVYFLVGTITYAVLNIIFNIGLVYIYKNNVNLTQLGDFSAIFFLGFTAYAITKHQLFNIKTIATETAVIALSTLLFVQAFLSNNIAEGALKVLIWILATYGGYILIKSVKKEIEQNIKLEELTAELEKANAHLKELDETKDNFLSMAAHELNTPIAAIEGYLSMIVDEGMCGPLDEKTGKYLRNIYDSSKRLAALVRDLLNVSRIESNRVHIIYSEAQIEDVIDQSIAEVKIKFDEVGHKLIWKRPSHPLPKTYLDISRIVEVIINLLGNAAKYTEAPGKIEVKTYTDENKIIVAVKDNGRGIPKDKATHIFEKFVQVDVLKDQVKGTGLGMFISKNLVEMHHGKLWFKSSTDENDHGTTFFFSLPILKDKPFDKFEGQGEVLQLK